MTDPSDTTKGTLALVFGILGCINILPLIGSILGIIFGSMAKGTAGESSGKIGLILGWITLCLITVPFIVYIILVFAVYGGQWAFWSAFTP